MARLHHCIEMSPFITLGWIQEVRVRVSREEISSMVSSLIENHHFVLQ
jgi:predicted nucleic-acid-binding protein